METQATCSSRKKTASNALHMDKDRKTNRSANLELKLNDPSEKYLGAGGKDMEGASTGGLSLSG